MLHIQFNKKYLKMNSNEVFWSKKINNHLFKKKQELNSQFI